MSHTPGPWFASHHAGTSNYGFVYTEVRDLRNVTLATFGRRINGGGRAEVPTGGLLVSVEEGRANAILAAAAPQLVTALRQIVEAYDAEHDCVRGWMLVEAREALETAGVTWRKTP